MTRTDRYRLLIDGLESMLSWGTYGEARLASRKAHDVAPYAEIRIRRPDEIVYPARVHRAPNEEGS